MLFRKNFGFGAMMLCVVAHGARAEPIERLHFDVSPGMSDEQLVTGAFIDDAQTFIPDIRVFGYEFGEKDPLQPFFSQDPGFNNFGQANGGTFPADAELGFDVLDHLLVWDGNGDTEFNAVPNGTGLLLERGSFSIEVGNDNALPLAGFLIDMSDSDGTISDVHLNAILQGNDGNNPAMGIYLVKIRITTNATGIADSDPFWLVYNAGLDEKAHEEAIDWVSVNLVPEPGMGITCLMGVLMVLSVRRKRLS